MIKQRPLLLFAVVCYLNLQCSDKNAILCDKIIINSNIFRIGVSLDSTKSSLIYPQSLIRAVLNDTDSLYAMIYTPTQENTMLYPNRYQLNLYFTKDKSQLICIDLLLYIKGSNNEFGTFINSFSKNIPLLEMINADNLIKGQESVALNSCHKYTSSLKLEKDHMQLDVNIIAR